MEMFGTSSWCYRSDDVIQNDVIVLVGRVTLAVLYIQARRAYMVYNQLVSYEQCPNCLFVYKQPRQGLALLYICMYAIGLYKTVCRPKSPKLLNYCRTFYKNRSEPDRTGQD